MKDLEFELLVKRLLEKYLKQSLKSDILVEHRKKIGTKDDYTYEADLFYQFSIGGFSFSNLVECKYRNRCIDRDTINTIHSKLIDLNIHKGIVVTTKGFQSGAISFAEKHGIALLKVTDDNKLNFFSHFDGNIKGVVEFLCNQTEMDLTGEPEIAGIAMPKTDIYKFLADKHGKEFSYFLETDEGLNYIEAWGTELPATIKIQFKDFSLDCLEEYETIETAGLPIKLFNEPELRKIAMITAMLKLSD